MVATLILWNFGGIVRDLEVQIGNALVPVDFHVLDIKLNCNFSLLLGRAFLSTVGAVCNLQTNQLCLTLIDPHILYNPILFKKPQTTSSRISDVGIIAACHCGAETISGNVDGKEGNAPETHGTRNGTHGDVGKVDMCVLNPVPRNPGRKWEGAGVSVVMCYCATEE
uniref:Uncharacterized protein n=1 Tax=Brassica campestris TaxID=3711 RepID=M4F3T7_BRACM